LSLTGKAVNFASFENVPITHSVATFKDSNTTDVASDFTATITWGDGTSSTGAVSGGNGSFTVTGTHTFADETSFADQITLTQTTGGSATATVNGTVTETEHDSLKANAFTFTPTENQSFTGTVATFTDTSIANTAGDFTASINWGDGTTSTGTVTNTKGSYSVSGTHTYTDDGPFTATVTLTDDGTGTATATATTTAAVADSAKAIGTAISATEGSSFSGTVATFNDADSLDAASDLSATIVWGDGNSSAGTISGSASTGFTVTGSNTYADDGAFTATVQITEGSTTVATATSTATVAENDLSLSFTPFTTTEATTFTGTVATFTDPGSGDAASDFLATMVFGDNKTGKVTVTGSNGSFSVSMKHKYKDEGSVAPVVYVTEASTGELLGKVQGTATVLDRDLLKANADVLITPTQNVSFTGTVANFTDLNKGNNGREIDFIASIDWGDGTSSTGIVTFNGSGHFSVSGTHTYTQSGRFTLGVTFTDDGTNNAQITGDGTARVAKGDPLVAQPITISAVESQGFRGTVATFFDSNSGDVASQFTATIDWGDGTTSTGTVTGGNGSFTVTGTHTYSNDDTMPVAVTLMYTSGSHPTTANSTALVAEGDASGTGSSFSATEGTAFTGTIATFTDTGSPDNVSDLSAVISWGDGTSSAGTISGSNGSFTVTGTHIYFDDGSSTVSVTLYEAGVGTVAVASSSTATIAEGDSLTGTGTSLSVTEGTAFSGTVATFTDTNPANTALGFTATIDWGDGTISAGTVIEQAGIMVVLGSHTYADEGSFTATATLSDPGSGTAMASAQSSVTAAEGDSFTGTPYTITAPPNKTFGVTVAVFQNANTSNQPNDFTATIDWGDGTTSAGLIKVGVPGHYTIRGAHNYSASGIYTVNVTIMDDGAGTVTATVQSSANIAPGNTVGSMPSGSSAPAPPTPGTPPPSGGGGSGGGSPSPSPGSSNTVYGDFNHDGYTDMAVGIPGYTVNGLVGAGAVEIFYGGPNGLSATPNLILTESSANFGSGFVIGTGDGFGFSLTVGDFNGDGYSDLAVGAPFSAVGGLAAAGNFFIFYGSASGLTTTGAQRFNEQSPGSPHFAAKNDQAAYSMVAGDFNGAVNPVTGYRIDDLAQGTPNNTPNPPPLFIDIHGGGTMFVLYGSPTGLSTNGEQAFDQTTEGMNKVKELPFEHLSFTLAVGDFNGDGYADVAIGIPFRTLGATQNIAEGGGVAILYGGPSGLSVTGNQYFDLTSTGLAAVDPEGGPQAFDHFGLALAAGDFNGAINANTGLRIDSLAIGAPGDAATVINAGAVYILLGTPTGLTDVGAYRLTQASLGNVDQSGSNFGRALAAGDFSGDGNTDLAIGAPDETVNGVAHAGAVYAVYGSTSGLALAGNQFWTQDSLNNTSVSQTGDRFGAALAVGDFNGDGPLDLAIGTPGKTVGSASGAGAIDVMYGSPVGLTTVNDQFWDENSFSGGTSSQGDGFGSALG
jgi:hypothetical protein